MKPHLPLKIHVYDINVMKKSIEIKIILFTHYTLLFMLNPVCEKDAIGIDFYTILNGYLQSPQTKKKQNCYNNTE